MAVKQGLASLIPDDIRFLEDMRRTLFERFLEDVTTSYEKNDPAKSLKLTNKAFKEKWRYWVSKSASNDKILIADQIIEVLREVHGLSTPLKAGVTQGFGSGMRQIGLKTPDRSGHDANTSCNQQ